MLEMIDLTIKNDNGKKILLQLPDSEKTITEALNTIKNKSDAADYELTHLEIDGGDSTLCDNLQCELKGNSCDYQELRAFNLLAHLLKRMPEDSYWEYGFNLSVECQTLPDFINMAYFVLQDAVDMKDQFNEPFNHESLNELLEAEKTMIPLENDDEEFGGMTMT
jgi:hypothetical protein